MNHNLKIQPDNIRKISKLLREIKFCPEDNRSYIFFPIETVSVEESDGIEFVSKSTSVGRNKELSPGLILQCDDEGDTIVRLAYADTTYSPDFKCLKYLDIIDIKPSKALKEFLTDHACNIVAKEYISLILKF